MTWRSALDLNSNFTHAESRNKLYSVQFQSFLKSLQNGVVTVDGKVEHKVAHNVADRSLFPIQLSQRHFSDGACAASKSTMMATQRHVSDEICAASKSTTTATTLSTLVSTVMDLKDSRSCFKLISSPAGNQCGRNCRAQRRRPICCQGRKVPS